MARCKLTNMNLRNIRKSREYQCLLIDLVKTGVVGKSAAEGLLGYTIPAGLLGNTTPVTPSDEDDDDDSGNTVTLLYLNGNKWKTAEYDISDDPTGEGIIAFAKTEFGDDTISDIIIVEEDPEYVDGESDISGKYRNLNPQPETIEPGMLIVAYSA